ncbi:uncharacterized protein LOC143864381 [Tasmannia lanceolata]|uniref:uncharacterized protein LOC143864381 n=1 Tax=Tasmannia lanceolata TaxID=3420 RepID=UPI0040649901
MAASRSPMQIILGSSSAPRQQILAEMGYEFTIMAADIDEKGIRRENPEELVMTLAEAKADAIMSKLQHIDFQKDDEPTVLITADQVVVYEGIIREKPSNEEEARQFIKGYSVGHAVTVGSVFVTKFCSSKKKLGDFINDWDVVQIYFHAIPDEVIENLIEEGAVLKVAGGLLSEHPLMSPLIESLVGTADSVMGLPKALTERLIQEVL